MAETRTINLEIKDNVKSLKAQYKEAVQEVQRLAQAYGETSQEVADAAKRAAELKDQIEDTNDAIASFKGEGIFTATGKALGAVASGFSAVEGAVALTGVESEKLQETMVRLQAAMALAQGLEGLEDAGRAFKTLKTRALDLGKTALTAFQGMTTASKAFALTGIGLVITGVSLLIANWDKLTSKEKFNYEEFQKTQALKLELLQAQQAALDTQYNTISKSSDETLKGIDLEIEKYNLLGKDTEALYKRRAELIQKTATESIEATNEERDKIRERYEQLELVQGNLLSNTKFYLEQKSKLEADNFKNERDKKQAALDVARYEEAKALRERAYQLKAFRENEFDKAENAESEIALMKLRKQKEASEKAKQKRDADLSELKGYIKEANKATAQGQMDDTEKAVDEVKRKYERQLALAKKYGKGLAEIETAMMNEINDIHLAKVNEQIEQENAAREQARLNRIRLENEFLDTIANLEEENYQRTLSDEEKEKLAVNDKYFELETLAAGNAEQLAIIEIAKLNELNDINLKYDQIDTERQKAKDEADKARLKRNRDFAIEMSLSSLQTIQSLTDLFSKKSEKAARTAFRINKAAQIASATISTYKSAVDAYASQFVPIPDPSSPVRGGIAAGVAVAAGLANIAKISSQKFEGGGSSGGAGSTPSAPDVTSAAPQFNTIGSSGINQLAQLQQQPLQAYVVSGEVTSAQALDRNRQKNATL
jgi:hypothetical protein